MICWICWDCRSGIKQNVTAFINEVRNYEDNLAIVLTKSDLKDDDECARVKETVEWMANDLFGKDVKVVVTSKFDDDVGKKLSGLIQEFNREAIFRQTFVPRITEAGERLLNALGVVKRNLNLDTSQLEEEIRKREKARIKLTRKMQDEKMNLRNRLQNSVKPSILADVENALHRQSSVLAQSLESGGANFPMLVNNILRPVLVSSTKRYVEESFTDFVNDFDFSEVSLEQGDASDICQDIFESYRDMQEKLGRLPENAKKLNGVYKAVTTALAVTTTVVAPWLELVLIFLPDIIGLLKGLMSNRKHEQVAERVSRQVIPDIICRLEPEVEKALLEMEGEMLEQLEENLNDMIDQEAAALNSAKEKLDMEKSDFAGRLQKLDQDISVVQAAIDEL